MVDNDQLQSTFLKKVSEVLEYLNKRKFCAADIDPDLVKYIPLYTLKNNVDPLMLLDIWPFISTRKLNVDSSGGKLHNWLHHRII
ncbi:hypothetical protein QE152_g10035 [Popillia japonica]|uniref:Uncharacterized protein n=1 Tax=Popillia japonica TaxID=7064 RepID=A0AAW1LVG6_POPJA